MKQSTQLLYHYKSAGCDCKARKIARNFSCPKENVLGSHYFAFKGIPVAAPVGKLRFQIRHANYLVFIKSYIHINIYNI
jgi:hypothetical protein